MGEHQDTVFFVPCLGPVDIPGGPGFAGREAPVGVTRAFQKRPNGQMHKRPNVNGSPAIKQFNGHLPATPER